MTKVPSKIFAGKLGDLSLRYGRYKLVRFIIIKINTIYNIICNISNSFFMFSLFLFLFSRFNAPKDFRTGPSRQHMVPHYGSHYLSADEKWRCTYEDDGRKTVKRCRVDADW